MQYAEKFVAIKIEKIDIFNMFAQNIDVGARLNHLAEVVLMSTQNLCWMATLLWLMPAIWLPCFGLC